MSIIHERWVTGKIIAEPKDAVIFYKDFGTRVQVTSWRNIPSLKDLESIVTAYDWKRFQAKGCGERDNALVFPNWYIPQFTWDETDEVIKKNQIIGRNIFEQAVTGVLRAIELKQRYTPTDPELKYVVIGVK